ncbi:hypothetical protein GCM10010432_68090 [Catellatospora methionotrophica]
MKMIDGAQTRISSTHSAKNHAFDANSLAASAKWSNSDMSFPDTDDGMSPLRPVMAGPPLVVTHPGIAHPPRFPYLGRRRNAGESRKIRFMARRRTLRRTAVGARSGARICPCH